MLEEEGGEEGGASKQNPMSKKAIDRLVTSSGRRTKAHDTRKLLTDPSLDRQPGRVSGGKRLHSR